MISRGIAHCLSGSLWLLARLPPFASRRLVAAVAFAYSRLARDARQTVLANLAHVADSLRVRGVSLDSPEDFHRFANRNLSATAQLLPEVAICWRGPPDAWRELIDTVHGVDALIAMQPQKEKRPLPQKKQPPQKGFLLLSPHLGNWELLNMYLGAEVGLTVLYDPPKIEALEPLIRNARQRTKSTALPIGPSGLRGMVQRLRLGGVVGLLPDQVPGREAGVLAPFFGKQALTINLVHRLVRLNQPRVFLVCALRKPSGKFDIYFDELTAALSGASELEAASAINRAIEQRVLQYPEQYQWSYKRFKRAHTDPGQLNIYRQTPVLTSDQRTNNPKTKS